MTLLLNDPKEFEGGDLELMAQVNLQILNKVMQFVLHHF